MTLWDLLKPVAAALGLVKAAPKARPSAKRARPRKPVNAKPRSKTSLPGTGHAAGAAGPDLNPGPLFEEWEAKPAPKVGKNEPATRPEPVPGAGHLTAPKPRRKKPASIGNQPQAPTKVPAKSPAKSPAAPRGSMQDRYEEVVRDMLAKYNIKVRKWRTSMSGIATLLTYRDGTTKRLLESPRPKSPLSMAIFLHEVGHHAIGIGIYKPRCLEEYKAWKFSIDTMRELGLPVTEKVERRMQRSMEYAVGKAMRRGIRELPPEVMTYAPKAPRPS